MEGHNHIVPNGDYHVPVLLAESIEMLNIKPGGVYVDCTFGGGGHSRAILEKLGDEGRLVAFDQDADARKNLPNDERVLFVANNFRHIGRFIRLHGFSAVDGILADLGVSSHQFDEPERGFSTRFDAALDMRMNTAADLTADKVLNTYSEQELHKLFEKYGEVTNAKTLAKLIVEQREISAFTTINKFKQAVSPIVKGNPNKYFAQVFQALRIEVNDEMGALEELLEQSVNLLRSGGRLAVITFHSLEDRMVKQFMKQGTLQDVEEDLFGRKPESKLDIITKKPVTAGDKELKINKRSRSAKLRVAEKKIRWKKRKT